MELTVSHEQGYTLAGTSGPIDDSAAEPLREYLHPLIAQPGTRLILDLSDSARIDSPGLGHLVKLVSNANTHSSRVVLARVQPFVGEVLSITRLNKFFEQAETLSEAVALVGGGK
jgi:anti-sigma B factor antagonist